MIGCGRIMWFTNESVDLEENNFARGHEFRQDIQCGLIKGIAQTADHDQITVCQQDRVEMVETKMH